MRLIRRTFLIAILFYSVVLCLTHNIINFKLPLLYFRPSINNKQIILSQPDFFFSSQHHNTHQYSPFTLLKQKKFIYNPQNDKTFEHSFIPSPILSDLKDPKKPKAKSTTSDLSTAGSTLNKSYAQPESLKYSNSMAALVTVLILVVFLV